MIIEGLTGNMAFLDQCLDRDLIDVAALDQLCQRGGDDAFHGITCFAGCPPWMRFAHKPQVYTGKPIETSVLGQSFVQYGQLMRFGASAHR